MAEPTSGEKSIRGFAAMDESTALEIQRAGGRASAASAKHYRWTPELAREVGRRGGLASQAAKRKAGAV